MQLRPYQQEALFSLTRAGKGKHLLVMATGTGKTFVMAETLRRMFPSEPVLWLVHRRELVTQADKATASNVHCQTIQTAVRRLDQYSHYKVLVIDEAHHAAAKTYIKIIEHIKADYLYGLTATPNRSDGIGLGFVFDKIVFEYNMVQAVKDGFLARPVVRQIRTNVSLDDVRKTAGDYSAKELERAINIDSRNQIVVQVTREAPKPALIFAVDVKHGETLSKLLNAPMVHGKTKSEERDAIYNGILDGSMPVVINCQLYTEGVDLPNLASVIDSAPTLSSSRYIQKVGRALRLFEGKTKGFIVDLVDSTKRHPPCQASTLIGMEPPHAIGQQRVLLDGDLLDDIPEQIIASYSTYEAIVRSDVIIKDWATRVKVDMRNIAFTRKPNGDMVLFLPRGYSWKVPAPSLIMTPAKIQAQVDEIYKDLCKNHADSQVLWDLRRKRFMRKDFATEKQLNFIRQLGPSYIRKGMSKYDAGQVISALKRVR